MTERTKEVVLKTLRKELVNAQDNLWRARTSFNGLSEEARKVKSQWSKKTPKELVLDAERSVLDLEQAIAEIS
jgi:hypothetical protein